MIRKPARPNAGRNRVSVGSSIPAPVGGWDAIHALAEMPADRAVVLENWFPTTTDVRIRRGHVLHNLGIGSGVVDSILVYNGLTSTASKMFAASTDTIYDISASGNANATDRTGLLNGRWQYINFTTAGGHFLWACNGEDDPIHYNGTVWAEPVITGITASDAIHVNAHKGRIWGVLKDSTKAFYLPTGSIAGAATTFELGGLFTQGGYLVAMATWTRDGGAGTDDLAVFISSRGQVVVYAGTDPASANTWEMIGVYDVGPPIGRRCFTKVGGDLALLNLDGVLPLSKSLNLDRASQATVSMTANINNAMNDAARDFKDNFGWELTPYAKGTMAILNVPIQEGASQQQHVMNTITGAWCKFTGMSANCWAVFQDELYFGGSNGFTYHADVGGSDDGEAIPAIGQGAYNYYKSHGQLKQWKMLQSIVTADSDLHPSVGISTDFADNATLGTPSAVELVSSRYDFAVYDSDVYAITGRTSSDWTGLSGLGQCASIHFRASSESPVIDGARYDTAVYDTDIYAPLEGAIDVIVRLNGFNVIHEGGGFF